MRTVATFAIILASLFAIVSRSYAGQIIQFINGNKLFDSCTMSDGDGCYSYIDGVADAMLYTGLIRDSYKPGVMVCLPVDVVQKQLVDVVVQYLTVHPEMRQYAAPSEILIALEKAFPCPK